MPLAHQAVQAIHAGIVSAREFMFPELIHPSLVLVTVPDEPALLELEDQCRLAGIRSAVFLEADMDNAPTALATEPVNGQGRKLFRKYPLFSGA